LSEPIQLDEITLSVVLKAIKNMHLRVIPPDGEVRLTAPFQMSPEKIRAFALSKLPWIKRQQKRIREQPWTAPLQYIENENHFVWGKAYPLQLVERVGKPLVELLDGFLVLRTQKGTSLAGKKALVAEWYEELVRKAVPGLVEKWQPTLGVQVKGIFVRPMKTRWGTCHPARATIRLNADLAQKPFACLEYVVVHEMVHLLEPSHNARYHALMGRFMPDWKTTRKQLKPVPTRP
jgi:predicted metal-dependent hydrolase